ncbi:MAG TPA: ABC transporter substrate-binding protein [Solirubrobacteraceae bacterium]|nr:ABC transporter substrate-binding protein [Solirubrobacteraceae bacterium]
MRGWASIWTAVCKIYCPSGAIYATTTCAERGKAQATFLGCPPHIGSEQDQTGEDTMGDQRDESRLLLSRRNFLHATAGVAASGALAEMLAACGSSSSSNGSQAASNSVTTGPAKRGGTLSVAAGDAATSENLDPQRTWNQNHDFFYTPMVWETLVLCRQDWSLVPLLAKSWEPNTSSTVWTFHLRPGVKWHDGKPFTARDAAWSIKRLLNSKYGSPIYGVLSPVLHPSGIKVVDDHTLALHLNYAHDLLPLTFAQAGTEMIQDGSDPTKYKVANAVGTGPFTIKSFVAGQSWAVARNHGYWNKGLPYLDEIRGVAIPDPTGMVQAVSTGSSDVSTSINFSQVPTLSGTQATAFRVAGSHDVYIAMDTRHKPFDDNRVRMAIKLAMDRKTIISAAYGGEAIATSDTPLPSSDSLYPRGLGVRAQNTAQAKKLLAQAGYSSGLQLQLYTSDLVGGMVDMATAFAQTVASAGIHVQITQHPAATYFEQIWLQKPMYCSWISLRHPVLRVPMTMTTDAAWQETHMLHTPVDQLLKRAVSAHGQRQQQLIGQMLTWIADNQAYVCPAFPNWVFATKQHVRGLQWWNMRALDFSRVSLA